MKKSTLWRLFITFFKMGLFTFGGGYVMLSVMQKEIVEDKNWLTKEDMLDLVGISQSTPGPFSVNAATFIGYKLHKFLGSIVATLGVVLPSFFVILLVSVFLVNFESNLYIQNALRGINAGVSVLIFKAWFKLSKQIGHNIFNIALMLVGIIVSLVFPQFSIIYLIFIVGLTGFILSFFVKEKKEELEDAN
ncbi:chromate transporter [Acholeplasma equirhinis]|uniref:chromate transporter n=1 Tax=Acholeplasma equirhinis TaxID=555393 RepID=UPI00197AF938|nr:chromate transporter [Acholeplasma equirhinis]MBN3490853.1 chromate transporter [Acholeplasma equirhinis]